MRPNTDLARDSEGALLFEGIPAFSERERLAQICSYMAGVLLGVSIEAMVAFGELFF